MKKPTPSKPSKTAAPPARRKLTLKKDTLKDLTAPARSGQQLKGGRSSSGGSVAGSVVT